MERPHLPGRGHDRVRRRRRRLDVRPELESLEGRIVLSLVAVSNSDAQVNTAAAVDETEPSVAMDATGDYVVAWNQQLAPASAYNYDVDARVYNAAGVAQTGPIVVANTVGSTQPSVAIDAGGDFVVAWNVLNGNTFYNEIQAQEFNLAGTAQWSSPITIGNNTSSATMAEAPQVAIDSAGDSTIAYQSYDGSSLGVFAQRFNSSGGAQGSSFGVNTVTQGDQAAPTIAMDAAGATVIAWENGISDPATPGIYAQLYNSSGGAVGGNIAIYTLAQTNGVTTPANPSVAMEANGQFVVAWQYQQTASGTGNGFQAIAAEPFSATGSALTGVIDVSSPANMEQDYPSVGIDGEGDYVVAWSPPVGTTSAGTVLAQRINASGTLIGANGNGSQFVPSTQSGDSEAAPVVATNANGNTVIAWQSNTLSQTNQNTYARLYDYVNQAPTINTPSNLTINENAGQQTVNLTGITTGGGETQTLTVTASSNNTSLVSPTVNYTSPNGTGTLTFTPAAGQYGTATITVTVTDNGGTLNGGVNTTSVQFTVTVNQVAINPTINTPSNVTVNENAGQQTVNLTGISTNGAGNETLTVTASSNDTSLVSPAVTYTSPNSTGTLTFTPAANSYGTATITVTVKDSTGMTSVQFTVTVNQVAATVTAVSADWGTNGTVALQTASDGLRLLPAGRNTDLPWYGINKLAITLSQPESLSPSDVSVTGITVANYGPVTISGSGTSYTITFAQAITTADRVTVTIGNAGVATYTRRLDVLPGDVNDDGVVNAQDLVGVRNDFTALGVTYNIFDDINGNGVVDINDTNLVGRFIGKTLPSATTPA